MYKVYCISYDLKKSDKDYKGLHEELKKSHNWWHYLGSTWLICTTESPSQVWDRISGHVDKNDYALIIQVTSNYQGWLPEEAWQWIRQYVKQAQY